MRRSNCDRCRQPTPPVSAFAAQNPESSKKFGSHTAARIFAVACRQAQHRPRRRHLLRGKLSLPFGPASLAVSGLFHCRISSFRPAPGRINRCREHTAQHRKPRSLRMLSNADGSDLRESTLCTHRRAGPASVSAQITYSVDTGEKPVNETFETGQAIRRRTGATQQHQVQIHDARALAAEWSLDRNGFVLAQHPTTVADFFDPDQLAGVYYPEVEQLVKRVSGASRVVVFDHTLRSGDEDEQSARKIREPVLWAHNDYTEWSGPQRVREILPDEAQRLLAHRFAIIQVWRAIGTTHPLQSACAGRCTHRCAGRSDQGRAALPAPGRRDVSARLQPGAPLVLLSAHAARRGAGVQGLRLADATAGRASRRTARSSTRPRRRARHRARASKCGPSRSSRRNPARCRRPRTRKAG